MYRSLRGAASDVRHHLLDLVVREVFSSLVPRVGISKTQARKRSMGSCRRHHGPIWNHGPIEAVSCERDRKQEEDNGEKEE